MHWVGGYVNDSAVLISCLRNPVAQRWVALNIRWCSHDSIRTYTLYRTIPALVAIRILWLGMHCSLVRLTLSVADQGVQGPFEALYEGRLGNHLFIDVPCFVGICEQQSTVYSVPRNRTGTWFQKGVLFTVSYITQDGSDFSFLQLT